MILWLRMWQFLGYLARPAIVVFIVSNEIEKQVWEFIVSGGLADAWQAAVHITDCSDDIKLVKNRKGDGNGQR